MDENTADAVPKSGYGLSLEGTRNLRVSARFIIAVCEDAQFRHQPSESIIRT